MTCSIRAACLFSALFLMLQVHLLAGEDQVSNAASIYQSWKSSGSIYILTTPEGANLPATASESGFPLLVRLHKDSFDFTQAKSNGEDIRFSSSSGTPLPYQIEDWNAASGHATIWVRIPSIKGNDRQEIRVHWGKSDALSESSGAAVFNSSNGYVSVWHMNDPVQDVVETLTSKDVGTTSCAGVIGNARHFAGKQGIFCGDKIPNYPSGDAAHSSEAWIRAERANGTILGWGNEGGNRGSKVRMQLRSPPHIHIDSDFSDVDGKGKLQFSEWIHVVHTYSKNDGRIYLNGKLDGAATPLLNIKSPARLWIGGWYNNYDFIGDIDEVRISKVARSADWVKLQYENQKPMQTLAGSLVPQGNAFSVSKDKLEIMEGASATISAEAGGAQKVFWILKNKESETVLAVDRLAFTFEAGRVSADTTHTLQFRAVYPNEVKTRDISVSIRESIPEAEFTLKAPALWDGRETIEIVPQFSNMKQMTEKSADKFQYLWEVSDLAVIKEIVPGKLILKRAQNSGTLTVRLAVSNGGKPASASTIIQVKEPKKDEWIARVPGKEEKPEDDQFYARDDKDEGTLYYNGTLNEPADSVFLKVYADDQLLKTESCKLTPEKRFGFAIKLKPGLIKYKVEFGSKNGAAESVLRTVNNLVCGDAYIIQGQSNAVSTDWGKGDFPETNEWIRSYGSMGGDPKSSKWGNAIRRGKGDRLTIGFWGFELAKRLVENQKVPICIINGAVGGTRVDQHQRNPENPEDLTSIYGRLLWRMNQAGLTHGVRGVFWHQGENDQGADGPTGGFGFETYRKFFIEMSAAWKQDYPNIQKYYIFQIWPKSCSMGVNGSDNRLREIQRTLPTAFSNMSIMSTLGIRPPGGCHYPPEGYAEIARLICPLVERDFYGKEPLASITPPNLTSARFSSEKKDEIILQFDQPVKWDNGSVREFSLDGEVGQIASGTVNKNVLTLKLNGTSAAKTITYLDSKAWSQDRLLLGENGIAALTFCEVPLKE